ncbi:hypothetical protein [Microcystis sp. M061S2]|nr:hypothetical protein [Microcystis sp. M061S2]MCA2653749.1 hypothetical protein [Microcystis sp. M061S2]
MLRVPHFSRLEAAVSSLFSVIGYQLSGDSFQGLSKSQFLISNQQLLD